MVEKITKDKLDNQDVLEIIAVVSQNNLMWSPNEIATAWKKTRNVKKELFCVKARENGNRELKIGHWVQALSLYNEAIVWAPNNSQHLAMAIANRAFIWMKLEEYQRAEVDLEWLLSLNKYPPENLHKIFQRLGIVKLKLSKGSESIEALTKSYELLKLTKLSNDQKRSTIEELQTYIKQARKISDKKPDLKLLPKLCVEKEHPELPGFSYKMSVKYSASKGRYTVANSVIEPGEIICTTRPVATNIMFDETLGHCYNCLICSPSPIPCLNCSAVVFCSIQCRQEASERYILFYYQKEEKEKAQK